MQAANDLKEQAVQLAKTYWPIYLDWLTVRLAGYDPFSLLATAVCVIFALVIIYFALKRPQ